MPFVPTAASVQTAPGQSDWLHLAGEIGGGHHVQITPSVSTRTTAHSRSRAAGTASSFELRALDHVGGRARCSSSRWSRGTSGARAFPGRGDSP